MAPKVSVVVPVYNVERYLRACLDSLVGQTLADVEIVAVNDASPDGSLAILRDFESAHPGKVTVVDSPTNLRQGGARNLGIAVARGEYLAFVDSDDWVDPTMYEKLYLRAAVTGADVVDCDYAEAYGEPARLRPRVSCTPEQLGTRTPGRDRALIRRGSRIVTKIVRRELFAAHGVRFPEGLAYEDNALATVWCLASRIEKVAEPLYFYRVNLQSTVRSRNSSAVFDRLQTSETMLQNSRDWGLYEPYRDEIDARFVELYYLNTIGPCLFRFDEPQKARLVALRAAMRERFPAYRRNPEFRHEPATLKIASWLNDQSPALLCAIAGILTRIAPGSRG